MLEFIESEHCDSVILSLIGRLDALTVSGLRPKIDSLVAKRKRIVYCDLERLDRIDSSGVGAIISLHRRLRPLGGRVKIANLLGQPREIFRLLRLDRAFEIIEGDTIAELVTADQHRETKTDGIVASNQSMPEDRANTAGDAPRPNGMQRRRNYSIRQMRRFLVGRRRMFVRTGV